MPHVNCYWTINRRAFTMGAALVSLLMISSIAWATAAHAADVLQKILSTHLLTVGTISGNPPWEFTKPNGQLDGYDIAIAKEIAAGLGVKVKFVQISGAGRVPALQTHKVDMVIAELDYTPQRAKIVAYTRAYANPASRFLVKSSSAYKTVEDLNRSDVTLGYMLGGDEAIEWPKLLPKAKLKAFTTVADAEQALLSGEVTATGESTVLDMDLMRLHPGKLRILNPPYDIAVTGIGVPYGEFNWWLYLDRWVAWFNFTGQNETLWAKYAGKGAPPILAEDGAIALDVERK